MLKSLIISAALLLAAILFLTTCESTQQAENKPPVLKPGNGRLAAPELIEVARSENQWTGIAVSDEGRIFVNFPRWSAAVTTSVAELTDAGDLKAYPYREINDWLPRSDPKEHFVCVQSVYIDHDNYLWVLDPGNPFFNGVIENAPKLVKIDLGTDAVIGKIYFDSTIAPTNSYLNDVRVDTERNIAYITDSGLGALIVVDLITGKSRRLLENHHSTKAEDITLTFDGKPWVQPDGSAIKVHSDGIALDGSGEYVYYQALTGRTLYRIATQWLLDESLSESQLADKVEKFAESGAADGIIICHHGNLYLSSIEENAIKRITPSGEIETVIKDPRIKWPDSFAFQKDGHIYFTISQIHLGASRQEPFKIYKFNPFL